MLIPLSSRCEVEENKATSSVPDTNDPAICVRVGRDLIGSAKYLAQVVPIVFMSVDVYWKDDE